MRVCTQAWLALTLLAGAAVAATTALAPPDSVVPYGKEVAYKFTPAGEYRSVRVGLSIRMDSPECSGSTHVLRLAVNGKPVGAALDRTHVRLLNKSLTARMASGTAIPWVRDGVWRVVYAPDFASVLSAQAGGMRIDDQPYRFVLDVTDLVTPGAENTLTVTHLGNNLRSYFPKTNPSLDFVLKELTLETSPEAPVGGKASERTEKFSAERLMVQPPATVDVSKAVIVSPGGGLKIALPGLPLELTSRFSYQGGGFNTLSATGKPEGQPEWKVTVRPGKTETVVEGLAREYRLHRTLRFSKDHLEVSDQLTNLTGEAIGLAFDNKLTSSGELFDAYLGGNPDPGTNLIEGMENTSVFLGGKTSGCGLLALDDVYRVQCSLYYDAGAGARSDHFALGPKAQYTLRWALYPVARADYYDFVNLARRDLDVNFTVPGGFQFGLGQPDDAAYQTNAELKGLRFMSSGVWFNPKGPVKCYHGEHMLQATDLQAQLRNNCAKIRRALPEVKSLIYLHAYINTDPEGPAKHPDAQITLADGKQFENQSYTQSCGIPFLYNYPALNPENSYMGAMKRVVDMVLDRDKIGADGVYWDEVDMISTRFTYDRWDGHSAELDDQHRIKAKRSFVHLLSLPAKVALVKYIQGKGGLLIGNSAPTNESLTKLHFPRFVETAAEWYPARAHLYTPLSLGDHLTIKSFADLLRDIRSKLMWGSLYYYYTSPQQPYPTITQHMFPFTPVELHRGWLVGKERLLTAVPGTFTLGDDKLVTVYWYDAAGKLTDKTGEQRVEQGRRLVKLALADNEMAVIERQ